MTDLATDRQLFESLYDRHATELLRFCFRRTGSAADAQDVLSTVFLEAWRRRGDLRPATARAWLYGIAVNVLRNRGRHARRHQEALDALARARPRVDEATTGQAEEEMRELLENLGRLPRRELEVVALCAWSGLSYEEAATALRIPVGTVRSRMSRARRRLSGMRAADPGEPIRLASEGSST